MGWWVSDLWAQNPALLISWVVWVIGSITLHELSHGWTAIRLGDRTPILTGHMTWNPLVHMGRMSLLMFAVVGIAWGMMPVDPARMRGRHAEAIVSFAGPAMNLLLAALAIALGGVWIAVGGSVGAPLASNIATFFWAGAFLNIVLAGLNLLPIPPLDGGRILAHYSPTVRRWMNEPQTAMIVFLIAMVVIFRYGGRMWGPAMRLAGDGISAVAGVLGAGA